MRKKAILIIALVVAIAVTGGVFAYTYTTASATIGATARSDYAAVTVESGLPSLGNIFGKVRGDVPAGYIFKIAPEANYTGDLVVKVYLTNADELTKAYQHLNMKMELRDKAGSNVYTAAGHTFELLTLDNGEVSFDLDQSWGAGPPFYTYLAGGSYKTNARSPLDWGGGYEVGPLLFCEVTQR